MSSENESLLTLLKDKKITREEYKLLSKAVGRATSKATLYLLVNPFQKIAGLKALIAGMLIILGISYLGSIAKIYFPGY